jgi:hypothetical protein
MNTKMRKLFLIGFAIMVVVAVLAVPMVTVEVTSTAKHRFEIDVRMARVRKIMVRTNAVKKIVAMADATLLDQTWKNMSFESKGSLLDGDWRVDGEGRLSIQINDAYLGQQSIQLSQTVDVQPNRLYSTNSLAQPSESIRKYDSTLELVPNADNLAVIENSLSVTVRTTASLLTRGFVRKEIEATAARSLEQQETAIRELVEEQRNKLIIMPDLGGD